MYSIYNYGYPTIWVAHPEVEVRGVFLLPIHWGLCPPSTVPPKCRGMFLVLKNEGGCGCRIWPSCCPTLHCNFQEIHSCHQVQSVMLLWQFIYSILVIGADEGRCKRKEEKGKQPEQEKGYVCKHSLSNPYVTFLDVRNHRWTHKKHVDSLNV